MLFYFYLFSSQTVQRTVSQLLLEVGEKDNNMRTLPSGVKLFDLLRTAGEGNSSNILGSYTSKGLQGNALVEILSRVSAEDLLSLQRGVDRASASYRFYQYNSSMSLSDRDIPTRSVSVRTVHKSLYSTYIPFSAYDKFNEAVVLLIF